MKKLIYLFSGRRADQKSDLGFALRPSSDSTLTLELGLGFSFSGVVEQNEQQILDQCVAPSTGI